MPFVVKRIFLLLGCASIHARVASLRSAAVVFDLHAASRS
jgi:hypothetical protein